VFPSDDFGMQEKGTDEQIKSSARRNIMKSRFPMLSKVGREGEPLRSRCTSSLRRKETNPEARRAEVQLNFEQVPGQPNARFVALQFVESTRCPTNGKAVNS